MYALIGLGGMVVLFVSVVMFVIALLMKKPELKKKSFKGLIGGLVLFIAAFVLDDTPIKAPEQSTSKQEVKQDVKEKVTKQEVKQEVKEAAKPEAGQAKKIDFAAATKLLKEDILKYEKLVQDIHVEVDEKKSQITFSIVVNAAVNDKYVLDLIDTVLRKYNLFCYVGGSSKEKWGNLYDDYSLMIGVATPFTINDPDKWLVYDAVAKGVQTRHKFKVKRK